MCSSRARPVLRALEWGLPSVPYRAEQVCRVELIENAGSSPRLMLGHVRGTVHVWERFEQEGGRQRMVTAWSAAPSGGGRAGGGGAAEGDWEESVKLWWSRDRRGAAACAP